MADERSYYPGSTVIDALGNLSDRDWKEIRKSMGDRFWWRRAASVDDVIAESWLRLEDETRKFYTDKIDINNKSSLKGAFVRVAQSIGDEYVRALRASDATDEEFQDESKHSLPGAHDSIGIAGALVNYRLSPVEILLNQESDRNVGAFLDFLARKNELLRQVCEMRRQGMKNRDIASHLGTDNKTIGNLVGDIKRHATRFFRLVVDKTDIQEKSSA